MARIQFLPPVPVEAMRPQRSKSVNELRDVLVQLRDGGTPPQDDRTTGTTIMFTAQDVGKSTISVSLVQKEIVTLHNTGGKAFYARASDVPNVKGAIRVALVTREMFEATPAFKAAEAAAHGVHALPQVEAQ